MCDDVDPIGRLPAAVESEPPIALRQDKKPIRGSCRRGDLRQARRRVPDAASPWLACQPLAAVVEHPVVVAMLQAIGAADDRGRSPPAKAFACSRPQPLGAGGVDDVVPALRERASDCRKSQHRRDELTNLPAGGPDAKVVGKQGVTLVAGGAEFFPQFVCDLRRAQPRVVGVVTNEQDAQRTRSHATAATSSSASSVCSSAKRDSYKRRPRAPSAAVSAASDNNIATAAATADGSDADAELHGAAATPPGFGQLSLRRDDGDTVSQCRHDRGPARRDAIGERLDHEVAGAERGGCIRP